MTIDSYVDVTPLIARGTPTAFRPDMTLALRRFHVLESLAHGGMGELFLVRDVVAGGRAVLKVRRDVDVDEHAAAARFEHEVEVLRALDHALIPRWLADGEWQGRRAVAVAHVEGLPLAQVMARLDRRFDPSAVIAIGIDVLQALHHVHNVTTDDGAPRGLVHRDVSPHNIVCAPDGRAHLIDFGIATDVGFGEETTTEVTGTLAYMAPEQASGQAIDERTDQFAVGVVLWELLSGTRLFAGETEQHTWRNVVRCTVPALPAILEVPTALSTVLLRMLAPAAPDRFASCADAAHALRGTLDPEPIALSALLVEAMALKSIEPTESTRRCRRGVAVDVGA